MDKKQFPYRSLHHYLDCTLQDNPNASDVEIKQTKEGYWRLYRNHYQKKRRNNIQEFTLGFDRKTLQKINSKKEKEDSISTFLYKCVFSCLERDSQVDTKVFGEIHQNQMGIIHLLEEVLDTDSSISEKILEKMELLELQINSLNSI